jgi:hypothetical protein
MLDYILHEAHISDITYSIITIVRFYCRFSKVARGSVVG